MSATTKMLCCLCGVSIEYNAAAMCVSCLRNQVDVTEGIKRNLECLNCGKCGRWHVTGDHWMHMDFESVPLMQHCVKKMALDRRDARIVDTTWIWTEPHSKRLKIAVDVEKEVMNVKLQQRAVVEFVIRSKQCIECIRENTDHTWGCLIQVRQRVGGGKASMYQLETLLTKNGMFNLLLDVNIRHEGFDMYFKSKNQAERVSDLIMSSFPAQKKVSTKMVSQDVKSHTKRMEHTILLEIAPVQKYDLLVVPKHLVGGKADLMLCGKLSSSLHLVSPLTLSTVEVSALKFFQHPFSALMRHNQLTEFIVLDITPKEAVRDGSASAPGKYQLAEAEVARASDLGSNDTTFVVLTHSGSLLSPGDSVMGYHLAGAVAADDELAGLGFAPPDVVLVRKVYPEKENRRRGRNKGPSGKSRQAPWRHAKEKEDDEAVEGEDFSSDGSGSGSEEGDSGSEEGDSGSDLGAGKDDVSAEAEDVFEFTPAKGG
eukprot:GSChrysophyteH1.ASY1.ANO1.878.1 assembled CDS